MISKFARLSLKPQLYRATIKGAQLTWLTYDGDVVMMDLDVKSTNSHTKH